MFEQTLLAGSQHQGSFFPAKQCMVRARLPNELWLGPDFPQGQRGWVEEGLGGREPGLVPQRKLRAQQVRVQVDASTN